MKSTAHFNNMLARAIEMMMRDDAVGEIVGLYRDGDQLKGVRLDPEDLTIENVHQYEMVLFDGGNEQGEAWKHVFLPISGQEIFGREDEPDEPDVTLSQESGARPAPALHLVEHSSPNYSPRTYHNANSADLTVALACDFGTAGEKLTHKAAGSNYLGVPIQYTPQDTAKMILFHLHERSLANPTINIAGNGIYTLAKKLGWSQHAVNLHVTHALALVNREIPIKLVVSGGQTGVDIAGIVAAQLLQIDARATFPKGFVQRFEDGQDVSRQEEDIRREILEMAEAIRSDLAALLDAKHPTPVIAATPAIQPPQDEFDFGF